MSLNNKTLARLYDAINKPSMNCVEKPESWKSYDSFCKEFITASKGHGRYFRIDVFSKEKGFPAKISIDDYVFFSDEKIRELFFKINSNSYLFKSSKQKDVDKLIYLLLVESTATESQLERVTELLYTYHI